MPERGNPESDGTEVRSEMSNILDLLFSGIMFIVFGACVLVSLLVFNTLASGGILGSYQAPLHGFYEAMNNVAIFVVFAMCFGAIGSAFMIKSHPMFLFVSIILIIVISVVIPPVVNSFNAIAQSPSMAGVPDEFPLLIELVQRLPMITIVVSAVAALVGVLHS
jgi:uncharacterized membrane-anchored protein YitT (DUF2179 family)